MTKILHLDRGQEMISADKQRLLRLGKNIFIGFIAIFTAILAKIKGIWFIDKIRKLVGVYDQKVFWIGHVACGGVAVMTIMFVLTGKNPETERLLFMLSLIYLTFYLLLKETVKDKNGESHWP